MNGKLRFGIICALALVLAVLMFPLSALVSDVSAFPNGIYPLLAAVITSPSNGTNIQVGQCFTVTAQLNLTCPTLSKSGDWPARPVYAGVVLVGASSVAATISISGNAALSQGQSAQVSIGNMACSGQATVSWIVCCTGQGTTVITVTPSGYGLDITQLPGGSHGNPWDSLVTPVYATAPNPVPIPADHIISSTITINQVAPAPAPRAPMFRDDSSSSGSGAGQQTWAMPADTKITTAFVQTDQVLAGQPVRIMANIANKGDVPGSYTATLMINNQVEATRKVTVPGNAAIPVEFTVTREKPGNYEADINGFKLYFTVKGQAANNSVDPKLIVVIAIAALIITAVVLLIRYLRAGRA